MILQQVREVARSAEDTYRYLVDFSTVEQWDPGVTRARKLSAGAADVGSRFEVELARGSGGGKMIYQLQSAQPPGADSPGSLRLLGRARGFQVCDTIEIQPLAPQRCRIDYRAELVLSGVRGVLLPLARPWLDRIGREALDGLARSLSEARPVERETAQLQLGERLLLPAMWRFTRHGYRAMANKGLSGCMRGKRVLITGPTAGIGLACAQQLARQGAELILLGRDPARLAASADAIRDFSGAPASALQIVAADLLSLTEIDEALTSLQHAEGIDVLINNAGALFDSHQLSEDGLERSVAINLVAPSRLSLGLLGQMRPGGRIINVASGGQYLQALRTDDMNYQRGRFDGAKAYARAKRALIEMTRIWAVQYPQLQWHAMHPGWVATPGVARSLPRFNRVLASQLREPHMGADTICWLASAAGLEAFSGGFWLDRQLQPRDVLPGTAVSAAQRAQLQQWLQPFLPEFESA